MKIEDLIQHMQSQVSDFDIEQFAMNFVTTDFEEDKASFSEMTQDIKQYLPDEANFQKTALSLGAWFLNMAIYVAGTAIENFTENLTVEQREAFHVHLSEYRLANGSLPRDEDHDGLYGIVSAFCKMQNLDPEDEGLREELCDIILGVNNES